MKSYSKFLLILITIVFFTKNIEAQDTTLYEKPSWAAQQLQKMTLEEKIAQIIIIRIHSNKDAQYNARKIKEIEKYQQIGRASCRERV